MERGERKSTMLHTISRPFVYGSLLQATRFRSLPSRLFLSSLSSLTSNVCSTYISLPLLADLVADDAFTDVAVCCLKDCKAWLPGCSAYPAADRLPERPVNPSSLGKILETSGFRAGTDAHIMATLISMFCNRLSVNHTQMDIG